MQCKFGKLLLWLLTVGVFSGILFAGANAPWGDTSKVQVGIMVQSGDTTSAWNEAGRADMTGDTVLWANPNGDGTYKVRVDLIPGVVYNYIWAAKIVEEGLMGFASGYQQAEPIPNNGGDFAFFASTDEATAVPLTGASLSYISIGGDSRRKIQLPDSLASGTTVYVFSNFASTPTGVANYSANIVNATTVKLTWQGALGTWGAGMPALDLVGGSTFIFVSTSIASGPYSPLAKLSGSTTWYVHSNLSAGTSYYYIFVTSDSYNGATNPATLTAWANLRRYSPAAGYGLPNEGETWNSNEYAHNDKFAKPQNPTPVYFKVERIDEEHSRTGSIVYLTPVNEDGRVYPFKMVGTLVVGYIPKS